MAGATTSAAVVGRARRRPSHVVFADLVAIVLVGLLDDNRYAVAVLVQHQPAESTAALVPDIIAVSAAVAPGGLVVR